MENASATADMTRMFRWLRLPWKETEPVLTPSRPLSPLPMITYDKGLPSLPDDVIYEIFSLLDVESLKSCSLTGKTISRSAKPFLHRTLYLTPRIRDRTPRVRDRSRLFEVLNTPGDWKEFKGLPTLGEHGLLQHTRHISIFLGRNPLFPHDLRPHVQYLHAITNLRSFKTRWLDIPSFLPRMEEYFGAFLGSLQSLELEYPRGDHKQILYFICQFTNLRDLRIKGAQDHTHAMRNGGPHFDINTFPPLDGALDLELYSEYDKGPVLIINSLTTAPLKFRTLKLMGFANGHSQLLIDACAPSLEYVDLLWHWAGQVQRPHLSFKNHPKLRKLELRLTESANTELAATCLAETLSTITSSEFTELTIEIARVSHSFHNASENQVCGWNSVDDVLDRLSLCEDVALVVRPLRWPIDAQFEGLIEKYFPLMWENGRVVFDGRPPHLVEEPIRKIRHVQGF